MDGFYAFLFRFKGQIRNVMYSNCSCPMRTATFLNFKVSFFIAGPERYCLFCVSAASVGVACGFMASGSVWVLFRLFFLLGRGTGWPFVLSSINQN